MDISDIVLIILFSLAVILIIVLLVYYYLAPKYTSYESLPTAVPIATFSNQMNRICSNKDDCGPGYFCSGICVSGPTGTYQAYCPCNPPYQCYQPNLAGTTGGTGQASICLYSGGQGCTSNNQCASQQCVNNICINL